MGSGCGTYDLGLPSVEPMTSGPPRPAVARWAGGATAGPARPHGADGASG
jgi:hypothetical protein